MKIHTVLILAGGDGDRFYPLEQKGRFRFNGKTVLQHIVESVYDFAEQTVIVTNSTNEESIKSDLSKYSLQFVIQTKDDGGMADAVIAAQEHLTKDTLILNGNDLIDFSIIPKLIEQTKNEGSEVGFVAKHLKDYFPGSYVVFKDNKAVGLIEKPEPDKRPSEYGGLVVDYFPDSKLFIDALSHLDPSDDQYERGMSTLMGHKPATCYKYDEDWTTLKYSWHVLSMQEYFFTHVLNSEIDSSATIHKTAIIGGQVHIGKNVKIGAYCKIMGPCYIDENVIIGDHSLIRGSSIGKNVLVGSGCEVARSYLAEGVMLHRNYVGDSVLSENVSMGAGAVTANYRFDAQTIQTPVKGKMIDSTKGKFGLIAGKNVKIGVNVSTYPGVKLSSGTMVLPGEVVTKDK
jgi:bifunctional UDP-N-acetylglucosamine pyrophosphorylase/glucosamine-1-phosphate N-acetyltransferase